MLLSTPLISTKACVFSKISHLIKRSIKIKLKLLRFRLIAKGLLKTITTSSRETKTYKYKEREAFC